VLDTKTEVVCVMKCFVFIGMLAVLVMSPENTVTTLLPVGKEEVTFQ